MITRHELPDRPYDVALQVWVDEYDDELDYTFIVSACREDDAYAVLDAAYDRWFDTDPSLTLFEELELSLKECGIPFEDITDSIKTLPVCVYCDSTDLYTEEEMYVDCITDLRFPVAILREWHNAIKAEAPFEEWYNDIYTAEDTDGLYHFAKERGFQAKKGE